MKLIRPTRRPPRLPGRQAHHLPTHVEGVYVAAGHEGNGIGLSLITGKLVSQMLRGETPLVDLAPLCIDRFGMNPPSLPSGLTGTAGTVPQAARKRHGSRGGPAGKARRTETGAPAPARKADRRPLRRPPSGRPLPEAVPPPAESGRKATAGRPQWKRGKDGDAGAKDGGRPPERGVPLQGFPSLGSRPRDVPQTSSRSRFRHGNDSAGERFFHVQVRFSPPARTGHHHL